MVVMVYSERDQSKMPKLVDVAKNRLTTTPTQPEPKNMPNMIEEG